MYTPSMLTCRIMQLIAVLVATVILGSSVSAGPDSFGTRSQQEDPYQKLVLQQIEKIAPTVEQLAPFREQMREYFKMRNGALRRISRQGGDLDVRVARDLNRCARQAVKAMSKVLTPAQLEHYEKLVAIGNEQYLMNAGLL